MNIKNVAAGVIVPLALVLAACGDDDDTADTGPPEEVEEAVQEEVAEEAVQEEAVEEEVAEEAADEAGNDAGEGGGESATDEAGLWANVPEVDDAVQRGEEQIQEGGVHAWGTIEGAPADIVEGYSAALEKNGWSIEGSGGDPSGELGAGVQASYEDGRYLSFNAGGPGEGTAFGDLCVWPQEPDDNNCQHDQDDQDDQDDGDDQDDQDDDGQMPEEVKGFIPDFAEQFIP